MADLCEIAGAALGAGAESLTLVNTVLGLAIDVETRAPRLGAGGGGLSGPAIHPVAVRAVHDVHAAVADLAIVGVGGVTDASTALELILAGAAAECASAARCCGPTATHRATRLHVGAARRFRQRVGRLGFASAPFVVQST